MIPKGVSSLKRTCEISSNAINWLPLLWAPSRKCTELTYVLPEYEEEKMNQIIYQEKSHIGLNLVFTFLNISKMLWDS